MGWFSDTWNDAREAVDVVLPTVGAHDLAGAVDPAVGFADNLWGGLSGEAAQDAAEASARGAEAAAAVQRYMYDQTRQDQMPYMLSGREGLYSLYELMGTPYQRVNEDGTMERVTPGGSPTEALQKTPGYQFRLEEGLRALDRSAAARGGFGGRNLRDMMRYGQDYASSEYGNEFNRRAAMAGIGSTANAQVGAAGTQAAGQIGNSLQNAGDARASGYMGAANAATNTLGTGLGMYFGGM